MKAGADAGRFELTDAEIARLPWAAVASRQACPPWRHPRRPTRWPECYFCAGTYFGHSCSGGAGCPCGHGYSPRAMIWVSGYWVPTALLREFWAERDSSSGRVPAAEEGEGRQEGEEEKDDKEAKEEKDDKKAR